MYVFMYVRLSVCISTQQSHLSYAVRMSHHFDYIVERQQAVTLDLGVDIFAFRAVRQQLHEVGVVQQQAVGVEPISLRPHDLDKVLELDCVVEEQQDLIADRKQLHTPEMIRTKC